MLMQTRGGGERKQEAWGVEEEVEKEEGEEEGEEVGQADG
jgi:hypothetical protein